MPFTPTAVTNAARYGRYVGRPLRIVLPHMPYHLASRGSNRQPIYSSDRERRLFLRLLGMTVAKHAWTVLAYCLMANHYHLVVEIADGGLSAGMQWLNGGFSRITNRDQGREAHLFRNRFASRLVESETHLVAACRYVVLNPVAAGLCSHPGDWRWSSYRATAGLESRPAFLADARLLAQFAPSRREARRLYRAFVADGLATLLAAGAAVPAGASVSDTVPKVPT